MVLGANLRGHITRTSKTTEIAHLTKDASDSHFTRGVTEKNLLFHINRRSGRESNPAASTAARDTWSYRLSYSLQVSYQLQLILF
jgi:hypothetical protein